MNKLKVFILKLLTNTLGQLLVVLQPNKVKKLKADGLTLALKKDLSFTERLMRDVILKKVEQQGDIKDLEQLHVNYWEKKGAEFFTDTKDSFDTKFLPECAFVFDLLKEQIENNNESYTTLVEIGTGNGKVLQYLYEKFPQIDRFVGIDLSKEQMDYNSNHYAANKKMEFVATDGFEWVKANGTSNTIFVTSRGVLEYFTQERLSDFLQTVHSLGKVKFVAIEPNGVNHNFDKNPDSIIYGYERSFSHNYAKLFREAGFDIWHYSRKDNVEDYLILSFVGATN